jgi:NAD+ synthase (glutamine-hydrolysing)
MLNYGFVKVAAAIPFGQVGGIGYNTLQIIKLIKEASSKKASIIVFPELSITAYTCGDLFHQESIIEKSKNALLKISQETKDIQILSIVGVPIVNNNKLYNCAALINNGEIIGIIPKSFIPGYREFYEPRWFSGIETDFYKNIILDQKVIPFGNDLLFIDKNNEKLIIGIEICEDLWMPIPPSSYQSLAGAVILCNLSASNILTGKSEYRKEIVKNQSSRCIASYIYVSSGMGESTTDVIFDADATIVENGIILAESKRFLRDNQIIYSDIDIERLIIDRIHQNIGQSTKSYRFIEFETFTKSINIQRTISPHPFIPEEGEKLNFRCNEIFNIQAAGLAKRFEALPKDTKAIIGISGGLDSTLALLVTIKTFQLLKKDTSNIIAITMPGFGTSNTTYNNTIKLCKSLNINFKELNIKDISTLMMNKVEHSIDEKDVVYENIQARARTYILMTAANKYNGIVIGTGDLSEIALGFATYNGDHISMYNVNSSVPKTLVKFLIKWIANNEFINIKKILYDILEQPISPELLPSEDQKGKKISQKTEKLIGPYELHDFFLYYLIRFGFSNKKLLFLAEKAFEKKYEKSIIKKWLKVFYKRFFKNQWKRDCVPAGPKIGSVDLSPRGSWRMPSEAEINTFLDKDNPQ